MAIRTPSFLPHKSRLTRVIQAMMPSVRAMAHIMLIYCVLVATRRTFYPNLPSHSPECTLFAVGTVPVAWALLTAAQWRKPTD